MSQGNRILDTELVDSTSKSKAKGGSMSTHPTGPLIECFKELKDPRVEYLCDHRLLDIVVLTICAVICGANTWTDVELFGQAKKAWLTKFLELPNGIPSHDTIGNVFARLDPEQFRACFTNWVLLINELTVGQVVAIDGKTVRRSHDRRLGQEAIHMVNAWATANNLVLGQIKVDDKSNEITAIPELLAMLDVSGCIVTIDAMGCQKEIAGQILDQDADYILAVKDNQQNLHTGLKDVFDQAASTDFDQVSYDVDLAVNKDHGRIEKRQCWVIADPDYIAYVQQLQGKNPWPGLKSIIKVEACRRIGDDSSRETRYYISSCHDSAKAINGFIRSHWRVENSLHWVLDIAFREDHSRVRKGHAAEIFAILRQMTLNLLKQEKTARVGIQAKRFKAALETRYLLRVLQS
jgi:predicted transposase YbfD/YdcC